MRGTRATSRRGRELAIVIFDSTVARRQRGAVYMSATAEQVPAPELDEGLAVFAAGPRPRACGCGRATTCIAPARHRLYRATASEHFLLRDDRDVRVPVSLP